MTLKTDANFEGKLTCGLENDIRNVVNFHQSTWKSQKWDFDWSLSSKVEKLWPENLQRSYVSWQWIMMQNVKRKWLVVSKLTWEIWQILSVALESLKNYHVNALLLSKLYIVWSKKYRGVTIHDTKEEYKIWRGINLSF